MVGKDIPVRSGVYVIEADEGFYVGQTRNLYQRWQGHLSAGKLHHPEIIYFELFDDEQERKYREYQLLTEFDTCGVVVLNKIR